MADDSPVWTAMLSEGRRFLVSRWPWRCIAYLISSVLIAVVLLLVLLFGLLFLPALPLIGLPVGALERRRLRLLDRTPAASPHAIPPPGLGSWLRCRFGEAATWREFGYAVSLASGLAVIDLLAIGVLADCCSLFVAPLLAAAGNPIRLGPLAIDGSREVWMAVVLALPATILGGYVVCAVAGAQAAFAGWLLAPKEAELSRRVYELASSRTRLVKAFEAERSRIERDLHDGAQQHLVLLNLALGLAEVELADRDERVGELITDAQRQARLALAAIRELIRGIHPQVLTDLGLVAAIGELAERCHVPVELGITLGRRLPAAVESTAYFVVSEALTNAVRHAQATRITVTGGVPGGIEGQRLLLAISDDGVGGADPARGSGLRGLADRTAVMDGTMEIVSPAGGPTTIRMELPCRCE